MRRIDESEAEQAGAVKRASSLLRSAKVVCQAGEYICLVRDVSEDGVLLSYLHEAPPEPRIMLVLGNGQIHAIQRLWAAEGQASYRFAAPVNVAEFLHERAPFQVRPVRLAIEASARLVDGSYSHTARLRDISTHGACFECDAMVARDRLVNFQIERLPQQLGQIVWRDEGEKEDEPREAGARVRYGLQFQLPLTLRELAATSLTLQPFGPVHAQAEDAAAETGAVNAA